MNGLSAAGGLLPAVGFAMLMKLLWDNKLAVFISLICSNRLLTTAGSGCCCGLGLLSVLSRLSGILKLERLVKW